MMLLSFWSRPSIKYSLSVGLIMLYCGAIWIVLHPNVSPQYQAYYIDKTGHCFHDKPTSILRFNGKIRFGIDRPAQSCTTLIRGWSWQEPWGTWSDGPLSEIDFQIESDAHQTARLRFHLLGFAPLKNQKVQVFLNHQFLTEWSLEHEKQKALELDVPIPSPTKTARLTFYFETPLALEWFGKSSNPKDQRWLTMGLLGFEWVSADPSLKAKEATK